MKLQYAEQLEFSSLKGGEFDIVICASGYESRATNLAKNIKTKGFKAAIGFAEHKFHPTRIINDTCFKDLGYREYIAHGSAYQQLIDILDDIINDYDEANTTRMLFQETVRILVDYSCMTKVWYSTILNYFLNRYSEISTLELTFSYSPSIFTNPQPPMPNKYMGPIPGIYRVSTSNKPTALVIGLGYEKETAKGIVEYLDPEKTFAFYSKPALDPKYESVIENNNSKLITYLGKESVFKHPLMDLKTTDVLLSSLCLRLRKGYRIILAPLGPKPFALMCLFLATRYPDIDVWRVSSGESGNIYDRAPAPVDPIICKAVFVGHQVEQPV